MSATTADRPGFAAGILVCGMIVMSFVDNLVPVFGDVLNVWQFHLLRATFALPLVVIGAAFLNGQTIRPRRLDWVALRASLMAASMLLFFASIPMLPMAQCTAGLFTAPLFVLVFSALFLGEPVGPRRIGAVIVGLTGVLLILRPFGAALDWRVAMPVGAGVFYAAAIVITRLRCREESPLALLFANFSAFWLMGAAGSVLLLLTPPPAAWVEAAPFVFRGWQAPAGWVLAGMAGMAGGAIIGIAALTRAYQLAEASFLTLFDYTYVIGANLFAWLIWAETPTPMGAAGVAMIVGAGLYIAFRGHGAGPLRHGAIRGRNT